MKNFFIFRILTGNVLLILSNHKVIVGGIFQFFPSNHLYPQILPSPPPPSTQLATHKVSGPFL